MILVSRSFLFFSDMAKNKQTNKQTNKLFEVSFNYNVNDICWPCDLVLCFSIICFVSCYTCPFLINVMLLCHFIFSVQSLFLLFHVLVFRRCFPLFHIWVFKIYFLLFQLLSTIPCFSVQRIFYKTIYWVSSNASWTKCIIDGIR